MRKRNLSFLFSLILFSFYQDSLPKNFIDKLERTKIEYIVPQGYKVIGIESNIQMQYDYAIQNTLNGVEIRYAIRPMDSLIIMKEDKNNHISVDLNLVSRMNNLAISQNISERKAVIKNVGLPAADAKKQYNADWGSLISIKPNKEFSRSQRVCLMLSLHKNNIGDAYIFYLGNSLSDIQNTFPETILSLKFK